MQSSQEIRWIAPEVLSGNSCSEDSDVWSYGMTLWEIFNFGMLPYHNCEDKLQIQREIVSFRLPSMDKMPERFYRTVKLCCQQHKSVRPNMMFVSKKLKNCDLQYTPGGTTF